MSRLFSHFVDKFLVAGQAEFPIIRRKLKQVGINATVGRVATGAFSLGKGSVLAEKTLFRLGLTMAGEAEGILFFRQQITLFRLMGGVTLKAKPALRGGMRLQGLGIGLPIMAGETKNRKLVLEQRITRRGMAAMAGQASTLAHGSMNTVYAGLLLALFMAIQTDLGRLFGQHARILTRMWSMTDLTVTILDRFVLRRCHDVIVATQAESTFKGLQFNGITLDLVAVVAVAAAYRRMDHLSKQGRVTGAMLRMAVDTAGCNRVALVCGGKTGTADFMTGGTQLVWCLLKQPCKIRHVRAVTGSATLLHRLMDGRPRKTLRIMTFETEVVRGRVQQFRIVGVVHFVTGLTFSAAHWFVSRNLVTDLLELHMTGQTDRRHRLTQQDRRNQPVRKMTGFAVLLFHRLVNNTLFKRGHHFRVTLGTGLANNRLAFHRGRSATCNQGKQHQANKTEHPEGPPPFEIHHAPPSSF